jgi:hypothetical protein
MRLLETLWILFLFFAMVTCGAQGCSWERATDTRGLSRHHASCRFYKKSSVLATQKRRERVKDAVSARLAHTNLSVGTVRVVLLSCS